MLTKPLAVVVLTEDARMLQADVAGHPVSHYLMERLRQTGDVEIEVALGSGVTTPAWCAGYRAFGGGVPAGCDPILIVDARAWLAPGLLEALIGIVRARDTFVRVLESSTDQDRSSGQARTLAAAFPARIFPDAVARGLTKIDRMMTWKWVDAAIRVEASDLQAAEPSSLLESLVELAVVEQQLLRQRAMNALRAGVRLRDPESIRIRGELTCGTSVEIDLDVIIEGRVTLEDGVRVGAHSIVRDARIGQHTRIEPFSIVESSSVGEHSLVGPYGRIRPGSTLGDRVQIGNYVEIKSSRIGSGSRINHHAFIGDADLADDVTIGAGTITCNHDGVGHVHTVIERAAYIGSGCQLVAPVRIGAGATVGAGSTITRDVPAAKLTVARSRQLTIDQWRGPRSQREPRP
jgi:acyl-[acyl carrier protein]--UDP-N-acetylglucosamine O-acyltransferase